MYAYIYLCKFTVFYRIFIFYRIMIIMKNITNIIVAIIYIWSYLNRYVSYVNHSNTTNYSAFCLHYLVYFAQKQIFSICQTPRTGSNGASRLKVMQTMSCLRDSCSEHISPKLDRICQKSKFVQTHLQRWYSPWSPYDWLKHLSPIFVSHWWRHESTRVQFISCPADVSV